RMSPVRVRVCGAAWRPLENSAARGHCAEALKDNKKATIVLIPGAPHTLNQSASGEKRYGCVRRGGAEAVVRRYARPRLPDAVLRPAREVAAWATRYLLVRRSRNRHTTRSS